MGPGFRGRRAGEAREWEGRVGGRGVEAGGGEDWGAHDEAGTRRDAPRKKGIRGGTGEAEAVAGTVSPTTGRRYALTLVCAAWRVCRATVYAQRRRAVGRRLENDAPGGPPHDDRARGRQPSTPPRKRGPRTPPDHTTLVAAIRGGLQASPFCTEGNRKVGARPRPRGLHVGQAPALRR